MTDVLEQLLKETEEDETEWEVAWSPTGLIALAREAYDAKSQSVSQMEQSTTAGNADLLNKRNLSKGNASQRLDGTQTLQDAAWSISERMGRLHKAVQRQEGRNVHSGGRVGPDAGRDALLIPGAGEQKRHTDYAALVDAVFARDARRYDGPLRLL